MSSRRRCLAQPTDDSTQEYALWESILARDDKSRSIQERVATIKAAFQQGLQRCCPLCFNLLPSGRFDALVDMGNPMKGINLFPFLERSLEGRALAAMGPSGCLELSRTVREESKPARWPREVQCLFEFVSFLDTYSVVFFWFSFFLHILFFPQ